MAGSYPQCIRYIREIWFKELFQKFTLFPKVLSRLALFAGAMIIANSVALATMERRQEIAMIKAVGAKSSIVLVAS